MVKVDKIVRKKNFLYNIFCKNIILFLNAANWMNKGKDFYQTIIWGAKIH